jgi:hypothetical protein
MDMIFIPNFKNKEGRNLIAANEKKFVSLMLIFGQLDLLKIISETCELNSLNEINSFEDRFFN